jgi:hypothetical protein
MLATACEHVEMPALIFSPLLSSLSALYLVLFFLPLVQFFMPRCARMNPYIRLGPWVILALRLLIPRLITPFPVHTSTYIPRGPSHPHATNELSSCSTASSSQNRLSLPSSPPFQTLL